MRPLATAAASVALALLTFFQFPGHTWLQQDSQIYVPILEHLRDPAVLRNDVLVQHPHVAFTLYDETALALSAVRGAGFRKVLAAEQIATRALGMRDAVQVDVKSFTIEDGDTFLLCCDGVWDLVSMREIAHATAKGPADGAEELIALALDRGAPDNVTVLVVVVSADVPMPEADANSGRFGFLKRAADSLLGR